jgi:archaellum component FlaF (FlaF/FlaG flagellin family)
MLPALLIRMLVAIGLLYRSLHTYHSHIYTSPDTNAIDQPHLAFNTKIVTMPSHATTASKLLDNTCSQVVQVSCTLIVACQVRP